MENEERDQTLEFLSELLVSVCPTLDREVVKGLLEMQFEDVNDADLLTPENARMLGQMMILESMGDLTNAH